MDGTQGVTRRGVLKTLLAGSGVVMFGIGLPTREAAASAGSEVTSWVLIHPDNRVVIRIPQTELGQGVTTALAQVLAEELDLAWGEFDTEYYDAQTNLQRNNVYVHTSTLASWAVDKLFEPMRVAGAQVKHMLCATAAQDWGVDIASLSIAQREVRHAASTRAAGFGALAARAAELPIPAADALTLKEATHWQLIGKSMPRVDTRAKTTGAAIFGIDVALPGMKYAAVRQSPTFGGRLKGFDASGVLKRAGVREVVAIRGGPSGYNVPPTLWDVIDWQMDDAVAVVADSWWQAQQALNELPIEWEPGPQATADSAGIDQQLGAALDTAGQLTREEGDIERAFAAAERRVEAEYRYPFMEHAPLEPMNCTALVTAGGVEAWAPTQYADEALRIAAYAAGVALKDAKFHLTLSGGGFGRRLSNDFVSQAVQVAKALPGTPIKLISSREECMRRGYYAPVARARLRAAIGPDGLPTAWHSKVAYGRAPVQPYGMSRFPWAVPNVRCEYATVDSPPPFGWMRGVAHAQSLWMNTAFLGEIAAATGKTSLAMQRLLLDEAHVTTDRPDHDDAVARIRRHRDLLERVVARAGAETLAAPGHGRGFAVTDMSYVPGYYASCVAMAVDVAIGEDGDIRVLAVHAVADVGLAVNPDIVTAQIQGGIGFGLSNALNAQITLKDGQVEQANFNDYPLLTLAEMPTVDVELLPASGRPTGIGEDAVPVVMAALVDAVRAAGGAGIRSLPLRSRKSA
jgi:isoquinoline 1-oxidoreductase beta subunit